MMAKDIDIRRGTASDLRMVMTRCGIAFSDHTPAHLPFDRMFPDTIPSDGSMMNQWLLAEADGELAAGLQIVPRPMVLDQAARLATAGIGNVFCYPPFRGQGLMSALLRQAIDEMRCRGFALALLDGDRLRYGRYGWEVAGGARRLTLRADMMRGDGTPAAITDFRRWECDPQDTARMFAAYQALPFRTERTEADFPLVLQRPNNVTWLNDLPGSFAYVTVRGGSLLEYAGSRDGIARLVRAVVRRGIHDVVIPPVPGQGSLDDCLLDCAGSYCTVPVGMVRILDLIAVLTAYRPVLECRLRGWNGTLTLRIDPEGDPVAIAGDGQTVHLDDAEGGEAALALSRTEMARLFFGPFPPYMPGSFNEHPAVRRLFPLPLYWHALSHV